MPNVKPIEAQWQSYRRNVIPADAPKVQLIESRRAFYAGAQALFHLAQSVSNDSISEDQGAAFLEVMHQELQEFSEAVKAGIC